MKKLLQLQCHLFTVSCLLLLAWMSNIQAQTPPPPTATNEDPPTLHAIIYGVTNDASVANGVELTLKHLDALLNKIQQFGGMEVNSIVRKGEQVSKAGFEKTWSELAASGKIQPNDAVLFYFIGHGFEGEGQYPYLVFQNTQTLPAQQAIAEEMSLSLLDIHEKWLKKLHVRLALSIGEACNTPYNSRWRTIQSRQAPLNMSPLGVLPSEIQAENIAQLFRYSKGDIIMGSSFRGQDSWVEKDYLGGIFSKTLTDVLNDAFDNSMPADWYAIEDSVKQRTTAMVLNYKGQRQDPIGSVKIEYTNLPVNAQGPARKVKNLLAEFFTWIAPNDFEKQMKDLVKDGGDIEAISQKDLLPPLVLPNLNDKSPANDEFVLTDVQQKLLTENPASYVLSQAVLVEKFWDKYGNEDDFVCDTVINEQLDTLLGYNYFFYNFLNTQLSEQGGFKTQRDEALIRKLHRQDNKGRKKGSKSQLGATFYANEFQWVKGKQQMFYDRLSRKMNELDLRVQDRKAQLEELDSIITHLDDTLILIDQSIKPLEQERNTLDKNRTTQLAYQAKLGEDLAALQEATNVGLGEMDINTATTRRGKNYELKTDKRQLSASFKPAIESYGLGNHCNTDIETYVNQLMDILLQPIDSVPNTKKQRQQLRFDIGLVGNADWVPVRTLTYKSLADINKHYKVAQYLDGVQITVQDTLFSIKEAQTKAISNRELAFLRAYCIYTIIQDYLHSKNIADEQITVQFTAVEHQKPQDPTTFVEQKIEAYKARNPEASAGEIAIERMAIEDDLGQFFRGVDIAIDMKNIFKHYVERIDSIEQIIAQKIVLMETVEDSIVVLEGDYRVINNEMLCILARYKRLKSYKDGGKFAGYLASNMRQQKRSRRRSISESLKQEICNLQQNQKKPAFTCEE